MSSSEPSTEPSAATSLPILPAAADLPGTCSAFEFGAPSGTPYPCFSHKDNKERWAKWGHAPRLIALRLPITRGGGRLEPSGDAAFLLDLFNSPALRAHLTPLSPTGTLSQLSGTATRVHAPRLATTSTSLSFFDALIPAVLGVSEKAPTASGSSGSSTSAAPAPPTSIVWIRRRLEEPWEGMTIGDALREALVLPPEGDPEGCDPSGSAECLQQPNRFSHLFTPPQRQQFLFHAARWVAGGGPMSQHEDEWTPYAAAVRDVARDLLTVVRGADGGVAVATVVWAVRGVEGVSLSGAKAGEGGGLFPCDSPHNVCWVCYDPVHRCAHVLHSSFVPYW